MGWIRLAVTVTAVLAGFMISRDFVRRRLRFVDGIYSPVAPWIAGIGAALIASPAALLPFITTMTTTLFGVAAGVGTASGVKALKRGGPA